MVSNPVLNSPNPEWLPAGFSTRTNTLRETVTLKSTADATVIYLVAHRRLVTASQWPLVAQLPGSVVVTDTSGEVNYFAMQPDNLLTARFGAKGANQLFHVAGKWDNDKPDSQRSVGICLVADGTDHRFYAWLVLEEKTITITFFGVDRTGILPQKFMKALLGQLLLNKAPKA